MPIPIELPSDGGYFSGTKGGGSKFLGDVLSGATKGRTTKGKSSQYTKSGGYIEAMRDFKSLNPTEIKQSGKTTIGKLEDGRTVNVRPHSSEGSATLDVYNPQNGTHIKIRYKE